MKESLKFDAHGLIPAIVQDVHTGQVLMMAYMNETALEKTLATGKTWFYSRSRQSLWMKGETSGHVQQVKEIRCDCDYDTLLILVEQTGAACHTGHYTCFYSDLDGEEKEPPVFDADRVYEAKEGPGILLELFDVIRSRQSQRPQGSYTTYLFDSGIDKILKKVGEESAEVIIAAKNPDQGELIYEASDLLYHLMVLLVEKGVDLTALFAELRSRR